MRYDVGRFRRPMRRSTEGQLMSLISLGDGSTLTLDFTTGQLDPRLTFTRASDATFINSSGLVQWADANHVQNSTMLNNTGTRWTQTTSGGTVTINGDGTVRFNGTGGRATWLQSVGSLASGLPMTFSFRVTSFTNTNLRTTDLFNAGTGFTGQSYFYTDTTGTTHTLTAFESLPKSGTNGVGTYSVTATTNATSANIIFGSDCNGVGSRSGDVTITEPQLQYGTVVPRRVYVPNSSIIAAKWDSARFDYDPTTLAPKGLLIEATATNSVFRSQALNTSPWSKAGAVSISETGSGSPANDSTSNVLTWTNSTTNGNAWTEQSLTVAGSQPYTWSVWLKPRNNQRIAIYGLTRNSGGSVVGNLETTIDFSVSPPTATNTVSSGYTNVTTPNLTAYPNGWYRMVATGTTPATAATTTFGISNKDNVPATGTNGCEVWGAQFEAGSGASSYIPTGASTVQRLADNCSIVSPNFAPWYGSPTGWTVVAEMTPQSRVAGSFPGMLTLRSAADSGLRIYYYNDGTYNTAFRFATASTSAEVFGPNGVTYGVPRKFGASVTSGTQFASSAGVQIGSTQTLAVPMDQTLLAIGSDGGSPTPAINCRMHFRSIKYWPYAMTLADLNARTA